MTEVAVPGGFTAGTAAVRPACHCRERTSTRRSPGMVYSAARTL